MIWSPAPWHVEDLCKQLGKVQLGEPLDDSEDHLSWNQALMSAWFASTSLANVVQQRLTV
jgi:hypothetical protein